jgi:uncharacterized paraquat-inducible protein A
MHKFNWSIDLNTSIQLNISSSGIHKLYLNGQQIKRKLMILCYGKIEMDLEDGRILVLKTSFSVISKPLVSLMIDDQFFIVDDKRDIRCCADCEAVPNISDQFCQTCGNELFDSQVIKIQHKSAA